MSEMPTRTSGSHPCQCVMIREGEVNSCEVEVSSADVPFCKNCEDRHPQWGPSIVVTTRPLVTAATS